MSCEQTEQEWPAEIVRKCVDHHIRVQVTSLTSQQETLLVCSEITVVKTDGKMASLNTI